MNIKQKQGTRKGIGYGALCVPYRYREEIKEKAIPIDEKQT